MKEYKYKINGNEYAVTIDSIQGSKAQVTVNGVAYEVEMENQAVSSPIQQTETLAQTPAPQVQASQAPVTQAQASQAPAPQAQAAQKTTVAPTAGKAITAPLPGVIIEINVKEGDVVKAGQQVAVLEAMKMENAIEAEFAGTVTAVHVQKGDSVLEGAPIVTLG